MSLQGQLTALQKQINDIIARAETGSLISVKGLEASHSLSATATQQVSTVRSHLAELSLLGGLVDLQGFDNSLTTFAGGGAGAAKVVAQPNVATVKIAGVLSAVIGPKGLNVDTSALDQALRGLLPGGVSTAPLQQGITALNTGLTQLTDALNTLLGTAGVHVTADSVVDKKVAADGSAASAALTGLEIRIDQPAPPSGSALPQAMAGQSHAATSPATASSSAAAPAAATPLLDVRIGAVQASSLVVAAPIAAVLARSAPAAAPAQQLAFTGAPLPLTGGIASLLLLGGVCAARRRRDHHLER